MTIYVEIKTNAAIECNNNPIFQESISPVFCLGETFEIDHSAADSDGDSLVYSICSSFKGAGIEGGPESPGSNPNSCTGVIPTPSCPPPYNFVDYVSGFSGVNPLGTGSQLSINPNSGIITVNPSIAGQYLVTICVNEFRNGSLINTSYREFTYLAAACQSTSTNENIISKSLKLFPNPASNFIQINIENPGASSNQIQIFNSYGQCIEKLDLISNNQRLDISGWPAGLYNLILLEDGAGKVS
ncbi:MAG: T9SS type A sorting domain-containing protein [Saprospiraceae bacterium]|nr:T9SS type A sorting domain-containing protein [Saprospiraceae bacterium]